ncbi:recombinase family protein [Streptomyces platensis]|uniref:hypothetical protein n=1 Tax=Streptomyces platensis TaxID=58346 RepID=UPI0036A269B0
MGALSADPPPICEAQAPRSGGYLIGPGSVVGGGSYVITATSQNPGHQIDALLRNGVDRDNIHVDVASGAKASRPELDLVMQLMRGGDTLKVT